MKSKGWLLIIGLLIAASSCKQKTSTAVKEKQAAVQLPFPPKAEGWVNDFEKVYTAIQIQKLDSIIRLHEKQTSNEIAIVTLPLTDSLIKTEEDFTNYSLALFNNWGIGKKEKNNGIGIILSVNLRKITIQVGKGLVTKVSDPEAKMIIDKIILPEFIKGDFYAGTLLGMQAIIAEIK